MKQLVRQLYRILLLYLASAVIASAADMPAQQQQFLSIISDFAQKYEAAPNDLAKGALRQQRAQAICGILKDLTVTNWVGTVNTVSSTDQGRGVLVVSLDKRSTIGTWDKAAADKKHNTLIKPRTAVYDAATVDFLAKWREMVGNWVTVTGCSIQVVANEVFCQVRSNVGLFGIDKNSLSKEDLLRSMRECPAANPCAANVTGIADSRWGNVILR